MKFFIADAFAEDVFGGNPAGVVIVADKEEQRGADAWPDEAAMKKTAAELRYSETAFISRLGENEFRIRYFTPAAEVDLCGHATIAAFWCLRSIGAIGDDSTSLLHTNAGDINVEVTDGFVMMDMTSPKYIRDLTTPFELDRLYETMGSEWDASMGLNPAVISTGLADIIMPVATCEELDELAPDMEMLSQLSSDYRIVGVHAFTLDTEDGTTCCCRDFAPLYGVNEEAATGTASGALTYYLYLHRIIGSISECRFIQGEKINRPSTIRTCIDASETSNIRVRVGGRAAILASGDIKLQPADGL